MDTKLQEISSCEPTKAGFEEFLSKDSDTTPMYETQSFINIFTLGVRRMLEIVARIGHDGLTIRLNCWVIFPNFVKLSWNYSEII